MVPHRLKVTPLQIVVILYNVANCEDAENDADRTRDELIAELNTFGGVLSKGLLESGLYCCNMQHERGHFWHPLNQSFDKFVKGVLGPNLHFDKYYNTIYAKKLKDGSQKKI